MEIVILVGHGSPKKDANRMELAGKLLENALYGEGEEGMVKAAYLQFETPGLEETIEKAALAEPARIIVHPFFISPGVHVTKDIPEIIARARARYPQIEFLYTEPLGIPAELINVAKERVRAARGISPSEIERLSFEKIERELDLDDLPPMIKPVVQRVIHATADFEFKKTLLFHPYAVEEGIRAIRDGRGILTDVEMVRAGINRKTLSRFGARAFCYLEKAQDGNGTPTRAERAIEMALKENPDTGIVAIGNAPTALIAAIRLVKEGTANPALVVGVPVGFVKAVEAKAALAAEGFPFITSLGRKGGSTVAAAIVNALLKLAEGE